jgi:hypothetical protein
MFTCWRFVAAKSLILTVVQPVVPLVVPPVAVGTWCCSAVRHSHTKTVACPWDTGLIFYQPVLFPRCIPAVFPNPGTGQAWSFRQSCSPHLNYLVDFGVRRLDTGYWRMHKMAFGHIYKLILQKRWTIVVHSFFCWLTQKILQMSNKYLNILRRFLKNVGKLL